MCTFDWVFSPSRNVRLWTIITVCALHDMSLPLRNSKVIRHSQKRAQLCDGFSTALKPSLRLHLHSHVNLISLVIGGKAGPCLPSSAEVKEWSLLTLHNVALRSRANFINQTNKSFVKALQRRSTSYLFWEITYYISV